MTVAVHAQAPAPVTHDALITAAKRAAGADHAGTFLRICVAPDNLNAGGPRAGGPGPRAVPDRATWYAKPYKVFDNLYFIGTRIHSAWALTTSAGIIVIDTLFDYAIEPEMVEGLTTLGLDPRDIKYVLISHAHGDHDQGAALLQSRYGAKVVMGAADWDATLQRAASAPGGVPKRDIAVGREGLKLTLGDTNDGRHRHAGPHAGHAVVLLPGQGRRTNADRSLTPAARRSISHAQAANFAIYRDSQRKMTEVAAAGWRDRPHVESHRVRPCLRPRTHRPACRARRARSTRTKPTPPPCSAISRWRGHCAEAQRLLVQ